MDRGWGAGGSGQYQLTQLQSIEAQSIHIIREVAAEFERPVLLFSGGKDSVVMLRLAQKAFWPGRIPFPVMHIDTGHNFPEVLEFRDRCVDELGATLVVASVQESIDSGRAVEEAGPTLRATGSRPGRCSTPSPSTVRRRVRRCPPRRGEGAGQGAGLLLPGRVRTVGPEEPAPRAVVPLQRAAPGRRAHPGLPPLGLDRARHLAVRGGRGDRPPDHLLLAPARRCSGATACCSSVGPFVAPRDDEEVFEATVRYRTVGDMTCTGAVESTAVSAEDIVIEVAASRLTERGATRADDRVSEAAMEDRKREGYF